MRTFLKGRKPCHDEPCLQGAWENEAMVDCTPSPPLPRSGPWGPAQHPGCQRSICPPRSPALSGRGGAGTGTFTARGGGRWPFPQVSSFPSFYVQSETDPLPSLPGLCLPLSPQFPRGYVCLVASGTTCLGWQVVLMPLGALPEGKEQDPGELRQCNLGGSAHKSAFSAPSNK